jgi:hypothetical protein
MRLKIPSNLLLFPCLWALFIMPGLPVQAAATTYYVSASGGDDGNTGLSQDSPFKTVVKVNGLALMPGDSVLLKCGDTWRGEMLTIHESGTATDHRQLRLHTGNRHLEDSRIVSDLLRINGGDPGSCRK